MSGGDSFNLLIVSFYGFTQEASLSRYSEFVVSLRHGSIDLLPHMIRSLITIYAANVS